MQASWRQDDPAYSLQLLCGPNVPLQIPAVDANVGT